MEMIPPQPSPRLHLIANCDMMLRCWGIQEKSFPSSKRSRTELFYVKSIVHCRYWWWNSTGVLQIITTQVPDSTLIMYHEIGETCAFFLCDGFGGGISVWTFFHVQQYYSYNVVMDGDWMTLKWFICIEQLNPIAIPYLMIRYSYH
jgi:hypothetical protein